MVICDREEGEGPVRSSSSCEECNEKNTIHPGKKSCISTRLTLYILLPLKPCWHPVVCSVLVRVRFQWEFPSQVYLTSMNWFGPIRGRGGYMKPLGINCVRVFVGSNLL